MLTSLTFERDRRCRPIFHRVWAGITRERVDAVATGVAAVEGVDGIFKVNLGARWMTGREDEGVPALQRLRLGAVHESRLGLLSLLPTAIVLAFSSTGHAQAIQPVTCLVQGSDRYGINTGGVTVTSPGNGTSAPLVVQSLGANGGNDGGVDGGNAGAVIVTGAGAISASGSGASTQGPGGLVLPLGAAVWAQSVGGCANVGPGNAAGAGGVGGAVSVTANAGTVLTLGSSVAGVYALSAGGQGAGYTYDSTHNLGPGGAAGIVTVDFTGTINGQNANGAYGLYALSAGGSSGATDSKYSVSGGNAGNVFVTLNAGTQINMSGDGAIAVFAASTGGLSWYADGGTYGGHQNGNGGNVTVTAGSNVVLSTAGELGIGILAVSNGGNSTTTQTPPPSLQDNGGNAKPSDYAPPGNAGNVTVNNQATITTAGNVSVGIAAVSATGGRGAGQLLEMVNGQTYVIDQVGQVGSGAGSPGTVTVTNSGALSTSGVGAIGILGLSLGGSGGVMDSKPGLLNLLGGSTAGSGANGGTVQITDTGTIATTGIAAMGILAQSIGGGGGTATGTEGVVAVGTNGGGGGNGADATVSKLGGSLTAQGDGAFGILAQSIGGGGGNGANASGLWTAVGGNGGASGYGMEAAITLQSSTVSTAGDFAPGIGAQSIGGGGGNGGYAKTYSLVAPVSTAIGGSGDAGGAGGEIQVTATGSSVATAGAHAPAVLAQSIGGGGGNGAAAAVYSASAVLTVTTAIGGNAGNGGGGGAVTVSGTGTTLATAGLDSIGILAQSLGGGGGNGGSALARSETLPSGETPTINITTTVGGTGGAGGAGGTVMVTNTGTATNVAATINTGTTVDVSTGYISTVGNGSIGILAQSIGGGGGNGGDASALGRALEGTTPTIKIGIGDAGKGSSGGDGGIVTVTNGGSAGCTTSCIGTIITQGNNAAGILAQSVGGSGGNGGAGNGSVSSQNIGVDTGTTINLAVAVGGSGGSGGSGGASTGVTITNAVGSLIQTLGSGSQGILAQSIGGGGGNAGGGVVAASGDSVQMNVAVGGSGGNGGSGQSVTVNNYGTISTGWRAVDGGGTSYTTGGDAVGILAQSIGGGGGAAGSSDAAATIGALTQIEDLLNAPSKSYDATLAVGGTGGKGGDGGTVQVTNTGSVATLGERAYGILAQSIGGGGGIGGAATSAANSVLGGPTGGGNSGTYAANVSVAGSGGAAGNGGSVTVQGSGSVLTAGYGAIGILAQSIGGGGGVGAEGSVNTTTTLGIGAGWSGSGGAAGTGGVVSVTAGTVSTLGDDAHGIVAQSIGGGGGLGSLGCSNSTAASVGGIQTTLCYGNPAGVTGSFAPWNDASSFTIHMGGGAGASGSGGDVTVNLDGALSTSGARSIAVVAQSIGGGGGLITASAANTASVALQAAAGENNGASGTVTVTQAAGASITTSGNGAWGILAQSLYGGGGLAGDPSLPIGSLTANTIWTSNMVSVGAGAVNVDLAGSITTTGANAHGVVAQSVGGGGGIANSSGNTSLALGNSATLNGSVEGKYAAIGGTVTVTVEAGATIRTTGPGSIGILAQSTGVSSDQTGHATPPINITVNGTVIGGSRAGSNGGVTAAGLVLSGGGFQSVSNDWSSNVNQVTIGASGVVGTVDGINGTAIAASDGPVMLTNSGTITGSIDLGNGNNYFINYGTLNAGPAFNLDNLYNYGTLAVGGKGVVATTTISGSYSQTPSGILAVDIDALAPQKADLLAVGGVAAMQLNPLIVPTAKSLLPGSYTVLTAAEAVFGSANVPSSLLFNWQVNLSANSIALSPTANFTPGTVKLTRGETSLANYLTKAWGNSDAFLAPLFGGLSQINAGSAYIAALRALSPESSHAQATALLNTAGTVLGAALSCPVFTTAGILLGEDQCTWAKVSDTRMTQSATRDTEGYQVSQIMYRVGAQKEVAPGWYLGGSLGGGPTWSSSDNGSSGQGYTVDGSVSVKHVAGPWLFAGSLAMAYGSYTNNRLVQLPFGGTAAAVLNSDSSMAFIAGRLRAGYEFTFSRGYIRPYADLDLVHSFASGYQERGASIYALDVQSSSQTSAIISPMVEFGGRYDLDGVILRPFLTAGVSFNTNAARVVNARFAGAAAQDGTFQTTLNSPAIIGIFTAGLTVYQRNGLEVKAEYGFSASDSFQMRSGSLRLAYHF